MSSDSNMLLEQALFTSVKTAKNEGYQIAACSSGITEALQRELANWGPSHDSLQSDLPEAMSMNAHRLGDGRLCVSLTRYASEEYSGRGRNIATWMLLVPPEPLEAFGDHPLRLIDAAIAAGWTEMEADQPLQLMGRARSVNLEAVALASQVFGPEPLAEIVERCASDAAFAVLLKQHRRLLLDALLSLLPQSQRNEFSFTTGLVPSSRRPLRLHLLAPSSEEERTYRRLFGSEVVDLTKGGARSESSASQLADLLATGRWCELRRRILAA